MCHGLQKSHVDVEVLLYSSTTSKVWKKFKFWDDNLLIRSRFFATFSTIEQALASRMAASHTFTVCFAGMPE